MSITAQVEISFKDVAKQVVEGSVDDLAHLLNALADAWERNECEIDLCKLHRGGKEFVRLLNEQAKI